MEQNEENKYTDLIIEILNIRYDTGLIAGRQLASNNYKFRPDLSDNKNSIFVEIKDKIETRNRGNVVPELNNLFASYINAFSNAKLALVVLSRLEQNNRKYCTEYFRKELGRSVEILDIKDLYDLAISYKLNIPNSLKYHFASVEELSNYYLGYLKQLTKEELSIIYTGDIFDNFILKAKELNEVKKSLLEIRSFYYKLDFKEQNIFYKRVKDYLKDILKTPTNEKTSLYTPKAFRVESIMNGIECKDEFFKNGIWENKTNEELQVFVDTANKGDYIVLKSFPSHQGMMIIKGVGVVKNNPHVEQRLEIDWFYRDSGLVSSVEGDGVFIEIPDEQWWFIWDLLNRTHEFTIALKEFNNNVVSKEDSLSHQNISRIAELNSDGVNGEDYLEIKNDVTAFAKVIAAKSFKPPLAIALFGNWGSGKSFFMQKLREKIDSLKNLNSNYCEGIVQIHFNAWSYLDANLWASIITQIFEKLDCYINDKTKTGEFKNKIEKELAERLTISKEQKAIFEKQKHENELRLGNLKKLRDELVENLEDEISKIRSKSLEDIIKSVDDKFEAKKKIAEAFNDNKELAKLNDEIMKLVPENYRNNPVSLYHAAKSKQVLIKEFFNSDKLGQNLIFYGIIVISVVVFPIILNVFVDEIKNIHFVVPQILVSVIAFVSPLLIRIRRVYLKFQPLITKLWNIKKDYEENIENAKFRKVQEERAIELEIERKNLEIESIEVNIQDTQKLIDKLDFKIENTLSTEALYSFISERTNSDDYKKHLGIISFIRRDLEILSQLFGEHRIEKEIDDFRNMFLKPIERIIIYIDDLDRCAEERVVEVLEAVNLLMAFPLFVVVVGVDPRWVKNSLIKKHQLQFTGSLNGINHSDIELISSTDYLEKIFQIPFHLKNADDNSVKLMIEKLSNVEKKQIINELNDIATEETLPSDPRDFAYESNDLINDLDLEDFKIINERKSIEKEHIELTLTEINLMKDLSEIVGKNPRAIKRFVNLYRLVKAHEDLPIINDESGKYTSLMMFLLAVPIGPFKQLTQFIYNYVFYNNSTDTLEIYFEKHKKWIEQGTKTDDKSYGLINNIIIHLKKYPSGQIILDSNAREGRKSLDFIRRFTFDEIITD